ncbi:TetR/AcrR family transcriptional regulator [Neptunomonas sp.]|uniref:TetR/AcrR family transcriptional regulator n=1 Tax=Neptunomonas sp. TaxID=1971898 RepID=UPI00356651CD
MTTNRTPKTQARIMQATLECILQQGIRATSTVNIAKQAGVSRGALVHHYPTKASLMEAAMKDLLDREVESVRETAKRVEEGTLEFETLLDMLHEHFNGDLFMVTLEFLTAARTDESVKKVLVPLAKQFNESLEAIWENLVSNTQHSEHENRVALNATLCMMRGMASQSIWRDDPELRRDMMLFWKQTLINAGFSSKTSSSVRERI